MQRGFHRIILSCILIMCCYNCTLQRVQKKITPKKEEWDMHSDMTIWASSWVPEQGDGFPLVFSNLLTKSEIESPFLSHVLV